MFFPLPELEGGWVLATHGGLRGPPPGVRPSTSQSSPRLIRGLSALPASKAVVTVGSCHPPPWTLPSSQQSLARALDTSERQAASESHLCGHCPLGWGGHAPRSCPAGDSAVTLRRGTCTHKLAGWGRCGSPRPREARGVWSAALLPSGALSRSLGWNSTPDPGSCPCTQRGPCPLSHVAQCGAAACP